MAALAKLELQGACLSHTRWRVKEVIERKGAGAREAGLEKYGWERHDGEQFGRQELYDADYHITTFFAKRFFYEHRGGDWAVRVIARQRRRKPADPQGTGLQEEDADDEEPGRTRSISFIFYIADEGVRLRSTPLPARGFNDC